nr:MFS transporter [Paenibacillus hamazuiensis]
MNLLVTFTLFYAFIYMVNAVYGTFIPVYFNDIGLSKSQIGVLLSLGPLVAILAQPVWGAVGDRAPTKNRVLQTLIVGTGISALFFPISDRFGYLLLVICIFTFFQTSIFAISDAIALEEVEKRRTWSFGMIRMGGTIGFAVMSLVFGIVAKTHLGLMFWVLALVMAVSFALMLRFPKIAGYQSVGPKMQVWVLFKHKQLMLYMSISFGLQVTLGFFYSFFPVYFKELGADSVLLGWSMVISSLSEIPFLLYSKKLFERVPIRTIFLVAGAATFFRWLLYYFVHDPLVVLPVQLLHGLILIVITVTMATYISKEVPKELRASGQTLNGLLNLGVARIIGSFLGGVASDWVGMRTVFLYNSFIALACVVVFAIVSRGMERSAAADRTV